MSDEVEEDDASKVVAESPDGSPPITGVSAPNPVPCRGCGEEPVGEPRRGPFGFRITDCPTCGKRFWYPLTAGSRALYWVILGLMIVSMAILFGSGYWVLPGATGVLSAVLLIVDGSIRKSVASATVVTALLTAALVSGVITALFAWGLGNAYTVTVVDRAASSTMEFRGIDLRQGEQICGDGDNYQGCLNMHIAMYNSVCVAWPSWATLRLSTDAVQTCQKLNTFIEDVRASAAACGSGCTTNAGDDGVWGYRYLRPEPVQVEVRIAEVTHQEQCWFDLGALRFGNCPGRSIEQ